MSELYPPIEPYDAGRLDVGDGHRVYWEACGNPRGVPAVVLHGGPGQGCVARMRQMFDPARYNAVLFDQRGCGRSTPHASDPASDLRHNTLPHLLRDLERLRAHVGVDRWLLVGGSWGSTLALAYAQRYPARAAGLVLTAVTTSRRAEIDWLYHGVARFFPEAFARFRAAVPDAASDRAADVIAAYARAMEHPDPSARAGAAAAWCAWEDAVVSLDPGATGGAYGGAPADALLAFARITAHYLAHGAWLEDGALLRDAATLAGIPGVMIHGRRDLSCPPDTAWALSRAWPGAELHLVDDAGHRATPATRALLLAALDRFAQGA